jgi:hypothetical protein
MMLGSSGDEFSYFFCLQKMLNPVSSFLVLCVVVVSLARSGVSQTGEKEGAVRAGERIRGRVSLLRAARAYRRFGENNRLQMPSRQPYKKAPKQRNTLNPKTRYRSLLKDANNVNTKQQKAPVYKARPKVSAESTRKKYSGVKFPKLDLFPQMRKPLVSPTTVLKVNTTVTDTSLPSQHRAGQGKETKRTVNSKALESAQSSNGRPRPNLRPHTKKV